ncbi:MAG TPA: DUF2997 domain-containing protein [Planctomycetes bacterium]|nr:DUF2997 domain-containing protein [Planctomycetota bacterium]
MKHIEIVVSREGKVAVRTLGFVGPGCREASRFVEEALGKRLMEQRTAEFYQDNVTRRSEREKA